MICGCGCGCGCDLQLWLGQYHDIALTTTAFDAEAATKHQFPLIIYIEMLKVLHCGFELELLKVLHCGFELELLKVLHCGFELNMLI